MSVFIFSTFYDKPIISLLIARIQAGSSSADACSDIFNSSAPYPPKEGRAKSPGVSPWIRNFFGPMILKTSELGNLCRFDFHSGENVNVFNFIFWLLWILFSGFLAFFFVVSVVFADFFPNIFLPCKPTDLFGCSNS